MKHSQDNLINQYTSTASLRYQTVQRVVQVVSQVIMINITFGGTTIDTLAESKIEK